MAAAAVSHHNEYSPPLKVFIVTEMKGQGILNRSIIYWSNINYSAWYPLFTKYHYYRLSAPSMASICGGEQWGRTLCDPK